MIKQNKTNKKELSDIIIEKLKNGAEHVKNAAVCASITFKIPYALFSFNRYVDAFTERNNMHSFSSDVGALIGAQIGVAGIAVCGIAAVNDHPEYLLIPLATNIGSLIYELRQEYKETKNKNAKKGELK